MFNLNKDYYKGSKNLADKGRLEDASQFPALSDFLQRNYPKPSLNFSLYSNLENFLFVLLKAIEQKETQVVKELLDAPNSFTSLKRAVNQQEKKYGYTPIMVAAAHGCVEITEILLSVGANPLITNKKGNNALFIAALRKQNQVLEKIHTLKPEYKNYFDKEVYEAFKIALNTNNQDNLKFLQTSGFSFSYNPMEGYNLFLDAYTRSKDEGGYTRLNQVGKVLKGFNFDINFQYIEPLRFQNNEPLHTTPLINALSIKDFTLARILLDYGADPNCNVRGKCDALSILMVGEINYDMIQLLLERGCNSTVKGAALKIAIDLLDLKLVKMLQSFSLKHSPSEYSAYIEKRSNEINEELRKSNEQIENYRKQRLAITNLSFALNEIEQKICSIDIDKTLPTDLFPMKLYITAESNPTLAQQLREGDRARDVERQALALALEEFIQKQNVRQANKENAEAAYQMYPMKLFRYAYGFDKPETLDLFVENEIHKLDQSIASLAQSIVNSNYEGKIKKLDEINKYITSFSAATFTLIYDALQRAEGSNRIEKNLVTLIGDYAVGAGWSPKV